MKRGGAGWVVVLVCLAVLGGTTRAAEPARPNVVVVLIDDMGYGDLGCYGGSTATPNIDRLAREGVRFTDFYSNGPVCTPTRCGFITGRYQQRVGLEWATGPGMKEPGLPTTETSIARLLKDQGYATAIFGKWHLGYKPEFNPLAHGFDAYFGLLSGNHDFYSHREINGEADLVEGTEPVEVEGYTTDLITERAVRWLDSHAGKPFFLYVPYNAVHWPFQRPDNPADVRERATWFDGTNDDYAAMLRRVDDGAGRLLATLEKHDALENTLFVFTDDNGGERLSSNAPLAFGKGTLWEGGIRVPCVIRWPGHAVPGAVVNDPAITMDLTATIAAAVGACAPADRPFDGIDLTPVVEGKTKPGERRLAWRIRRQGRDQDAIRVGRWKYLRDGKQEYLFDVVADPGEKDDRSRDHAGHLATMKAEFAHWQAEVDREPKPFQVR